MTVGAALGLSYLLLAPSLAVRAGYAIDLSSLNIIVLKAQIFNVLYLFVWLGMLCFKKWRKVALEGLPMFTLVVVIGMSVLQVLVWTARSAFPSFLMTTVMYAYFVTKISWPKLRMVKIIMCVAAWAFMLVHLVMVARMAVIVSDEWDRAMQIYTSDECKDGVVYMDYTSESKCSPLLLRKIVYGNLAFAYGTCRVSRYIDKDPHMMVVPACLKGYHDFAGTPIPGNAGAKIYKGCVVVKTEEGFPNLGIADFGMGKSPRLLNVREFHGADGCRYLYFDIQYHFWEHLSDGKLRYLDLL
jgi:hypothetical protein